MDKNCNTGRGCKYCRIVNLFETTFLCKKDNLIKDLTDIVNCSSYEELCEEALQYKRLRFVFCKDFKGKIGKCYKSPIIEVDTMSSKDLQKFINSYEKYEYYLVAKDTCSPYKDSCNRIICENDIIEGFYKNKLTEGKVIFINDDFGVSLSQEFIPLYDFVNSFKFVKILRMTYENKIKV